MLLVLIKDSASVLCDCVSLDKHRTDIGIEQLQKIFKRFPLDHFERQISFSYKEDCRSLDGFATKNMLKRKIYNKVVSMLLGSGKKKPKDSLVDQS